MNYNFQVLTLVEFYKKYGGVIATNNETAVKILSKKLVECPEITETVANEIIEQKSVTYFINLNKTPIDDNALTCRLIYFK